MSAAWPARGLADMPIALLAVTGFNGTRYALHCDSQSQASRKVTLTYYPGSGGARCACSRAAPAAARMSRGPTAS